VIKLWLEQLNAPIVPDEMAEDFLALMHHATTAPLEFLRHLKDVIAALPRKNLYGYDQSTIHQS
jgi:hypothetical protein